MSGHIEFTGPRPEKFDVAGAVSIKPGRTSTPIEGTRRLSATFSGPGMMQVGDRVKLGSDTNRMRRRVVSSEDETTFQIATFMRPSKGFRRHVRRRKAAERD